MKYEYYNPSPKKRVKADGTPMGWHKGDCTTRALSKALDLSWKEAFKLQCEKGMELCEETSQREVYEAVLLDNGFNKGAINKEWIKKYHCRPKVSKLIDYFYQKNGKKKVVVKCPHHLVAAEGDILYDTWNSGDEAVLSFWYK